MGGGGGGRGADRFGSGITEKMWESLSETQMLKTQCRRRRNRLQPSSATMNILKNTLSSPVSVNRKNLGINSFLSFSTIESAINFQHNAF